MTSSKIRTLMPDKSWRGMRPGPVTAQCISRLHSDSRAPFQQRMRCTWPEIQTIENRRGRKDVSEKDTKSRLFITLEQKNVDFFAQLSVLASCPASTSSWDRPQTKQRLSKWCGVELRVSLATRRNSKYMKKSSFFTGTPKWALAISLNKLFHLSHAKLQKNSPGRSSTVQARTRGYHGLRSIDRFRPSSLSPVVDCPSSVYRIVL